MYTVPEGHIYTLIPCLLLTAREMLHRHMHYCIRCYMSLNKIIWNIGHRGLQAK